MTPLLATIVGMDRGHAPPIREVAMTDLGIAARAYLTGRCGDDDDMAEAVVRVLFQRHPYRQVAKDLKVPIRTLQRKVPAVRRGLDRLITSGQLSAVDLIAKG